MRAATLFSGIMAPEQARPDFDWIWCAEIEPFPCSLIKHHRPSAPNLGDVTKITEEQVKAYGPLDLVVFGSPCQDLSIAGKREGLSGARSGLFFTAINIIRWSRARFALWENVPGAYSSNGGKDFAAVVGALSGLEPDVPEGGWRNTGAFVGPAGLVEWATLDAQWFGVPQRRRRVFALADFGHWSGRLPILLEPYGLSGHTPPRREAGKGVAGAAQDGFTPSSHGSYGSGNGTLRANGDDLGGGSEVLVSAVAMCLNAGGMGRIDAESETFIPLQEIGKRSGSGGEGQNGCGIGNAGDPMFTLQASAQHGIAHALRAEGFDASEDGTGRGTPLVPRIAGTLTSNGDAHSGFKDENGLIPIAFDTAQITSKTNRCNPQSGDPCHTLHSGSTHHVAIGVHSQRDPISADDCSLPLEANQGQAAAHEPFTLAIRGRDNGHSLEYRQDGTANALLTPNGGRGGIGIGAIAASMAVRRLVPEECELLQGFPRGYTHIPIKKVKRERLTSPRANHDYKEIDGEVWQLAADGPRYKALGNSMAVPVLRWILDRIEANA